jgi:polysaccharide export outer membrane protein
MKFNFALYLMLCLPIFSFGQDQKTYRMGIDDRLQINFWQETATDLNSTVRVREDGKITLPVIGDVAAAGLTTNELAKEVVRQMAFYNPGISQATVVVLEYNSQSVVLTGAVNRPGKLSFERIPNLLDILREAGGAADSADLSKVTIIRQESGKAKVLNVNLLRTIKDGNLTDMPQLQAKDMIHIPRSAYGTSQQMAGGPAFKGKNVYFIYGAIGQPGVKDLGEEIDIVDAIAAAGGTVATADLRNIRLIMKDVQYSSVLNFNLEKYSKGGRPARYTLRPEDTIIIPFRSSSPGWLQRLSEIVLPAVITTITTTIIVRELSTNAGN